MTTPPENPPGDDRAERLFALTTALHGHKFTVVSEHVLHITSPDRPGVIVQVRCAPRFADDGRLWFVVGADPLAEADHVTETLTALKGLIARM